MLRFQVARAEGRDLVALCPLRMSPLWCLPAEVSPRSSLCFITGLQIQLMRASLRMALWATSTITTSKYLYAESCRT